MPAHAWLAWVLMVMAVALSTTNPLYLVVVLLCVLLVGLMAPRTGHAIAGLRAMLVLGAGLFLLSVAIAAVNGGFGEHVLFTIPGPRVPGWLGGLQLGGPVTGEGLVAAAVRGLAIFCVLVAFAVFNGAVSPHRVLRLAPAALFHAGLVVTVGLALLPSSIEDLRRIREMRALRGGRTGLRDLPALVVPAIIGGLERAMRLAEAMEARGFAASSPPGALARLAGLASVPLLLAAAWGWFYYEWARVLAPVAALLGVAALFAWARAAASRRHTTRLSCEQVTGLDHAAIGLSLVVGITAIGSRATGWPGLGYNPFAGLQLPPFALDGALLALATAWPALRLTAVPAPGTLHPETLSSPGATPP